MYVDGASSTGLYMQDYKTTSVSINNSTFQNNGWSGQCLNYFYERDEGSMNISGCHFIHNSSTGLWVDGTAMVMVKTDFSWRVARCQIIVARVYILDIIHQESSQVVVL